MAIRDPDIKLLWGRSGNRCAMCRIELSFDAQGTSAAFPLGEQTLHVAGLFLAATLTILLLNLLILGASRLRAVIGATALAFAHIRLCKPKFLLVPGKGFVVGAPAFAA